MRLGILSITDELNYGNRLQNYACNVLLKEIGETENIIVHNISSVNRNTIKYLIFKILPGQVLAYRKALRRGKLDVQKMRNFRKFTRKMNNVNVKYSTKKDLEKLCKMKNYNAILVGSDQVWNPDFAGYDYFFLCFIESYKRFSFAASIGYDKLSPEVLERYAEYWKQMNYISVRESSAADIVEQAIGKRPDIFLDPTLFLKKEEWDIVSKKPRCRIPSKYILCLFLGKMPIFVEEYAKRCEIEYIILNNRAFPEYYVQGPSEFVWLVQNAELVLTDSFHCSVFSIIYHKQFWVFKREDKYFKNMFTRMETLLARFDMMDRIQNTDDGEKFSIIESERFINADLIRNSERQRVMNILKELIKI